MFFMLSNALPKEPSIPPTALRVSPSFPPTISPSLLSVLAKELRRSVHAVMFFVSLEYIFASLSFAAKSFFVASSSVYALPVCSLMITLPALTALRMSCADFTSFWASASSCMDLIRASNGLRDSSSSYICCKVCVYSRSSCGCRFFAAASFAASNFVMSDFSVSVDVFAKSSNARTYSGVSLSCCKERLASCSLCCCAACARLRFNASTRSISPRSCACAIALSMSCKAFW